MQKQSFFSAFLLLFAGLFLASGVALAQVAPDASGSKSLYVISGAVDNVLGQNLTDNFKSAGLDIATRLMGGAKILAGALALATLLWQVLIAMVNGDSVFVAATESVLYAVVAAALLAMYPQIVNDIVGLGTWMLGATGKTLGTAVHDFMIVMFVKMIDVIVKGFENVVSLKGLIFLSALDGIVSMLLLAVATFFMITALVELIGVVLAGPVVIGIAIALGPLFIATLASHWTRRWFSQWINFLVNGAMLTGMVVIVLILVTGFIATGVGAASTGYLTGEALMLALLGAGMGKIFSSIPSLADGLFPGRTSAGSASAGGKAITSAPQAAKSAATSAAQGVSAGGKAIQSAGEKMSATANVIKAASRMSAGG